MTRYLRDDCRVRVSSSKELKVFRQFPLFPHISPHVSSSKELKEEYDRIVPLAVFFCFILKGIERVT